MFLAVDQSMAKIVGQIRRLYKKCDVVNMFLDMKTIPGRKDDPFSKTVLRMMKVIEEKIRQTPGIKLSSFMKTEYSFVI